MNQVFQATRRTYLLLFGIYQTPSSVLVAFSTASKNLNIDVKENSNDRVYEEISRVYCVDLLPYQ
jgi:hypothetical protein